VVPSLLVAACNSLSAGAGCSSVMTLQTKSWRRHVACRVLQATQLVLLSLGMTAAQTDMVGKRVKVSGERERIDGRQWNAR
jgi:hypothetical protein